MAGRDPKLPALPEVAIVAAVPTLDDDDEEEEEDDDDDDDPPPPPTRFRGRRFLNADLDCFSAAKRLFLATLDSRRPGRGPKLMLGSLTRPGLLG